MQPGALGLIAYPALPPDAVTWMQDLRRRFDPHFGLLSPHFTFVFPVLEVTEAVLATHAESVLRDTRPIDFTLTRATVFPDPKSNSAYVFLVPDRGYDDMVELNAQLYTGPLAAHRTPGVAFTPHITIAHQSGLDLMMALADAINDQDIDISGRLDRFTLVRRTETGLDECHRIDVAGSNTP